MPFLSKSGGGILSAFQTNVRQFFVIQNHYFAPLGYYYCILLVAAGAGIAGAVHAGLRLTRLEIVAGALAFGYFLAYLAFVIGCPGCATTEH